MNRELRDRQFRDSSNLRARGNLHGRFRTYPTPWFTWIFEQMQIEPGNRVLEVGCGPGTLWFQNLRRIPRRVSFILSDFSAGMVGEARQQLQGDHRFGFAVCEAQAIPLADETCNVIIANHVLFFVPDIPHALREIHRVLRAGGGRFYATTNGASNMHELGNLLADFDPALLRAWDYRAVTHRFDFEIGYTLLEPWFTEIRVDQYPDRLLVTDPAALSTYVLSMSSLEHALSGREDEFRRFVESRVDESRPFHISKDTGMFAAVRK